MYVNGGNNKYKVLSGGCVLHYKKNLVLENYYNYDGKAFGEDFIHSFLLYKKSINLYLFESNFIKYHKIHDEHYNFNNFKDFVKYLIRSYKIRKYLLKTSNGNIFFFFFLVNYMDNNGIL